jgi:hypothetical protein
MSLGLGGVLNHARSESCEGRLRNRNELNDEITFRCNRLPSKKGSVLRLFEGGELNLLSCLATASYNRIGAFCNIFRGSCASGVPEFGTPSRRIESKAGRLASPFSVEAVQKCLGARASRPLVNLAFSSLKRDGGRDARAPRDLSPSLREGSKREGDKDE